MIGSHSLWVSGIYNSWFFFSRGWLLSEAGYRPGDEGTGLHPISLSTPAAGMGEPLFSTSSKGPGLAVIDQI